LCTQWPEDLAGMSGEQPEQQRGVADGGEILATPPSVAAREEAPPVATGREEELPPPPTPPQQAQVFEFQVRPLEVDDAQCFIGLQDAFAEEHRSLTRSLYLELSLRDWQLALCCPARILDEEGCRETHVRSMVLADMKCYKSLHVLKAMAVPSSGGGEPACVGYVMYETCGAGGGHAQGSKSAVRGQPWIDLKQIYVATPYRHQKCGSLLFEQMLAAVDDALREDVRICVLDLNTKGIRWFRSMGFIADDIRKEVIGNKDEVNVIAFVYMQRRLHNGRPAEVPVPSLFKTEVVGEILAIDYPDNSGAFEVKVVDYDPRTKRHKVDTEGFCEDGEEFSEDIDLNLFFRNGHVHFRRQLSLVHRDVELERKALRKRKAEEKQEHLNHLARARAERENALDRGGRASRAARRQQQQQQQPPIDA